jgi:hypothetical protein
MLAAAKAVLSTVDEVEQQVKSVEEALEARGMDSSPAAEDARAVKEAVEAIRNEMTGGEEDQPDPKAPTPIGRQIRSLYNAVEASTAAPTTDQRRLVRRTWERLGEQVDTVNRLMGETLPELKRDLDEAGIPWTRGRRIALP